MAHPRDTSKWGVSLLYPGVEFFLKADLHSGLHTIQYNGRLVDILIEDRGSDTTLVVFHANLPGPRSRVPAFQGGGLAASTGTNLVAIADPSVALGDLSLAWYLGDKWLGSAPQLIAPLIRHAVEQMKSSRTILIGGSGGGYAAVNFGEYFPESVVLVMNPRLRLSGTPRPDLAKYLKVCHDVTGTTPAQRIMNTFMTRNLEDKFENGLPFKLLLMQNHGDYKFWDGQFAPFVDRLQLDPNLWVRIDELGDGHIPYPPQEISEVVRHLASAEVNDESGIVLAGFLRPSEVRQ